MTKSRKVRAWAVVWKNGFTAGITGLSLWGRTGLGEFMIWDTEQFALNAIRNSPHLIVKEVWITPINKTVKRKRGKG